MTLARAYFAAQALAFAAWWLVLAAVPATREGFMAPEAPFATLGAFATADLAVVGLAIAIIAAPPNNRVVRLACAWATVGAVGYAALYCATLFALSGGALVAAVAMVPAAGGSMWAARRLSREWGA